MSTTIMSNDSITLTTTPSSKEVDYATCDCCGLKEECTVEYIHKIREIYQGKWLCGLCAEAVKDEALRCDDQERIISSEEALNRHLNFCKTFQSSSPPRNPTLCLISAMRCILRKSLDSPKMRSMPCSPTKKKRIALNRSESCIPAISFGDSSLGQGFE